ncbi:hypothetical protein O6P43_014095 [Quillaja saponaria]|uniref:Uncharacterized protein n=1 Tax=Quillaja saponaria TaxID=32244 RepID=A0AAD7LTX9_QUISA|nr:hypothetical protein O6P43_014095 [Quillaja saponaria]
MCSAFILVSASFPDRVLLLLQQLVWRFCWCIGRCSSLVGDLVLRVQPKGSLLFALLSSVLPCLLVIIFLQPNTSPTVRLI